MSGREESAMGDERLIEAVARVLCVAAGLDPDSPTFDIYVPGDPVAGIPWAGYRPDARNAIAAIRSSGYAIVPHRKPTESATAAVAEAWASIDGKLDGFHAPGDPKGHHAGYMAEAEELICRIMARGYAIVPLEGEGFEARVQKAAEAIFAEFFGGTSDPGLSELASETAWAHANAALRAALSPGDDA
jgi:hypothetical protein